MCLFKSAIVRLDETRKEGYRLLHSPYTDSHSELIQMHGLREGARCTFARVEYSPKDQAEPHKLDTYTLRLDEGRVPHWWTPAIAESVAAQIHAIVSGMIVDRPVPCLYGGAWVLVDGAKVEAADFCRITMLGGTLNQMRGGTLNQMRGGTLGEMWDGTLGEMWDGTLNQMRGGTLGEMRGGTLGEMLGGTLNQMRGGTLNRMWGGTLNQMRGGTLGEMLGGTLNQMWDGTLGEMRGGTLNQRWGGTLNQMRGGTLGEMLGGTLNQMLGGTLGEMLGGTLVTDHR